MVKPGITGWAQINYPYGASVEDSRCKLEYDLYYAKNYTPFLDLRDPAADLAGDPVAGGCAVIGGGLCRWRPRSPGWRVRC
jgi:hypothetical protein